MKIRDFELKDQTVLEIGKFAILWNWFEKEFCHNECNYKELKKVAPYVKIDFQSQKDLAEVFEQRRFLFEQMIDEYVRTALYPDNAKRPKTEPEERKAMEGFLAQKEEYIVLGCLMSIYRIRCNMMHGLKIVKQLDNQYELFKAVNGVLESIR